MANSIEVIEQSLRDNQAELDRLVGEAAAVQGKARAMAKGLRLGAVEALNTMGQGYFAQCEAAADCRPVDWSDPLWETFQPVALEPEGEIRLGGFIEQERLEGEEAFDFPVTTEIFSATGPIVIASEGESGARAREMFQALLLRIALFHPGQVRFTLLDPLGMGAAFPFRGFLGREQVRSAGRAPMDELAEVLQDIRRINERVIGDAPSFASLSEEQRSGELFEIIAVADFPKAYAKDPRTIEALTAIANAGSRAGRYLIMEWDLSQKLPHGFEVDSMNDRILVNLDAENIKADTLPSATRQRELIALTQTGGARRGAGDWNAIVRPEQMMAQSAARRIATPVGERLTFWLGENQDGKPCAHSIIAGQTGSGKSFLLHVIICGLAARYSPDELRFTLIDGKQGVEFEAYRSLPHADTVCLRTSPALARSVLADFVAEMDERYARFQQVNVVKLEDYRVKTQQPMPRRLLVIDEYQQILEGDSEAGATLLAKLLEKGRAAGMHAVLGSQTFEQRGLPHSSLTHIHSWASLSLTENYAQSLQVFGSEGKRLIRDLAATGEVVLNDEGGRDGANARGAVARLRTADGEDLLPGIIADIARHAGTGVAPVVLSGRDGAVPADNPHLVSDGANLPSPPDLQALARRSTRDGGFGMESWSSADRPVPLWLGRKFDVRDHALCALRRAPSQNLLVVGSQAEARHRMLAVALAGIGALLASDTIAFSLVDGLRPDMPGGGILRAACDRLSRGGFDVSHVASDQLADHLDRLAARTDTPDPGSPSHILVISDPDYLYDLHGGADRFSAPRDGPTTALRRILSRGPQAGLHTILSVSSMSAFQLLLSPAREAALFNHKVVQQLSEEESMSLFSSLVAARLRERADHPNAALLVDQLAGARSAALFHGYCAQRDLAGDQGLDAIEAALNTIAYPRQAAHVA